MKPFAVFIAALTEDGQWAATTRAADRGEQGKIGLPGGKVDPGEHPLDAAIREAAEEGWYIAPNSLDTIHEQYVDGNRVTYFASNQPAVQLEDWKEKGRIQPVTASYDDLVLSGYGNVNAMPKARLKLKPLADYDV